MSVEQPFGYQVRDMYRNLIYNIDVSHFVFIESVQVRKEII